MEHSPTFFGEGHFCRENVSRFISFFFITRVGEGVPLLCNIRSKCYLLWCYPIRGFAMIRKHICRTMYEKFIHICIYYAVTLYNGCVRLLLWCIKTIQIAKDKFIHIAHKMYTTCQQWNDKCTGNAHMCRRPWSNTHKNQKQHVDLHTDYLQCTAIFPFISVNVYLLL